MLNTRSDYLVILLATYNRLESLKRAVDSISAGTRCSHEIIVIDGGSTDGTIEYLRGNLEVTPVFQAGLIGQARACNQVWQQVESKYTCWLSDDTKLVPGSLDLAVSILDKQPSIGMVGLKTKDVIGRPAERPYMGYLSEYGILTCNQGVLSMELLRAIGYFNEDYYTRYIDPDLTASVLCTGKSTVLTRQVSVLHYRVANEEVYTEKRKREMAANREIYHKKFEFLASLDCFPPYWYERLRKVERILFSRFPAVSTRAGLNKQDRFNLLNGRFIRPTDPLESMFRCYYLVQSIPPNLLKSEKNPYRHLID